MIVNSPQMDAFPSLAGLTRQLVDIPSVTGSEREVCDWMAEMLSRAGFRIQKQPVTGDRYNLAAIQQSGSQPVWLCTHLDTVAPWVPSREENGRLFGRGVCDAKGIAAAMTYAAVRLAEQGERRVGLLFVVGEETDSAGARKAVELDLGAEYVVVGEPTEGQLARGQKGTLVFRLSACGEAGHSADPRAGKSAVHALLDAVGRLRNSDWDAHPVFGETTLNIGRIEGGTGANVVAASASAVGIYRVAGDVTALRRKVEGLVGEDVQLEVLSCADPFRFYVPDGFPSKVVAFGSDAPYLAPLGKVLMAGPGSIHFAHRDDEQITLAELEEGVDLYVRLVRSLLGVEAREAR